jgi:hypothetical protein
MSEGTGKTRKPRTNLTLDSGAKVLGETMAGHDRRSLTNFLEHLVIEEAKRRGLPIPSQAMEEKAA